MQNVLQSIPTWIVNESIYQVPLAEQEVREVGSVLRLFGKLVFCICFKVYTISEAC